MEKLLASVCLSLVAFAALWCTVDAQSEPQITKLILPEIKRVGMTGRLNCTVTRQENNKVYWIHQDRAMVITNDDKVDIDESLNDLIDGYRKFDVLRIIEGDLTTYQLIIRRLQLTDAGVYTCQINVRGDNKHPSKDGELIVLIPPTIIQGLSETSVHVQEGQAANLTCDATGYPTPNISWVRANGDALPSPISKFRYKGKILQLNSLHRTDRGVYRCLADNAVRPPATYDTTLYIDFKPFSKPVQTTYGQAQNRLFDLIIECIVSGYPAPDLRWYKVVGDGLKSIGDDDKHTVHTLLSHGQTLSISERWFQLTIINVQANDYGKYVCEGTNVLGTAKAEIQVYETSECQGPNCPPGAFGADTPSGATHIYLSVSAFCLLLLATLL